LPLRPNGLQLTLFHYRLFIAFRHAKASTEKLWRKATSSFVTLIRPLNGHAISWAPSGAAQEENYGKWGITTDDLIHYIHEGRELYE
jgi:hypothetical protein